MAQIPGRKRKGKVEADDYVTSPLRDQQLDKFASRAAALEPNKLALNHFGQPERSPLLRAGPSRPIHCNDVRARHVVQSTAVPSLPQSVDRGPRTDRPRTNADPAEVHRKLALLDEPHVKPLSDFVRELRTRQKDDSIPWFDPTEAGTEARILMLLEAPGRQAAPGQGSGFISPDNNDGSAENMWNLQRQAGVNRRRELVTWNVVPWYIGSDSRIRAARGEDIQEAHLALVELLKLLGDVRVVLLLGRPAAEAWQLVGVDLPTIEAPHPSPKNLNSRPHYRPVILQALHEARPAGGLHRSHDSCPKDRTPRRSLPRGRTKQRKVEPPTPSSACRRKHVLSRRGRSRVDPRRTRSGTHPGSDLREAR